MTATADLDLLAVERALIGGVLLDAPLVPPPLLAGEFTPGHAPIWSAILAVCDRGERPDLVTVHGEMIGDPQRPQGWHGLLAMCIEDGCIAPHAPQYARIVRDAARRRAIDDLARDMRAQGLNEVQIAARLDAIPGPISSGIWDPGEAWRKTEQAWGLPRLMLGIEGLDRMTGGLGRGELLVVGGRTSHGKTSFTVDAAVRLARRGVRVEILTLEETQEAIVRRLVGNITGQQVRNLKAGVLSPMGLEDARTTATALGEWPLTVTGLETMQALDEDSVLGVAAQSQAEVVMLDHLQKVLTRDESRAYGLERVLNRLHALGLKSGRTLWVNAQLNREMESAKRPPEIADLRDSGAIEILARHIWMLYWPVKHDAGRAPYDYELYVRKAHDAGTGMVPLLFEAGCGRFTEA